MADQIEINIYMRDGTGADINAVDDTTGGGTNLPDVSNSGNTAAAGTKNSAVDLKKLGKYVSSQTIEVFIANTKSVISQNIGLITGKTELQQRVNFGMSITQQGVNVYKSAAAGAIAFGAAGAIAGALGSIMGSEINRAFRQNQLNIQEGLENRQIQQTRTRAGASFNRSREGN